MKLRYVIFMCLLSLVGGALLFRWFDKEPPLTSVEFNFSGNVTQITPAPVKLIINGRTIIRDSLIHDTILLPLIADTDTAAILADYNAIRYYDDKLVDNDSITIRLREALSQNRILHRSLDYSVHASAPVPFKPQIFAIGGIGLHDSAPLFSIGTLYQRNEKSLYGASIGFNRGIMFQVHYGISF
jgi:hypothetical protein